MNRARGILRALWGPLGGQKRSIAPGDSLHVGRLLPSSWAFAHDERMSAEHFELRWDGTLATLRDTGSSEGTEVGGLRIDAPTELRHGAWVRAGGTDFRFFVEGQAHDAPPDASPTFEIESALETLRAEARSGRLFGLVDASRSERITSLLSSSVDEGRSLYEGYEGAQLERFAPFLIRFEPSSALLDRLVREGWLHGWASYFTSDDPERLLRRHFRRFLFVDAEGLEGRVYFRFYDPRVLSRFLRMATARQHRELTGPVEHLLLPDERGFLLKIPGASALAREGHGFDPRSWFETRE